MQPWLRFACDLHSHDARAALSGRATECVRQAQGDRHRQRGQEAWSSTLWGPVVAERSFIGPAAGCGCGACVLVIAHPRWPANRTASWVSGRHPCLHCSSCRLEHLQHGKVVTSHVKVPDLVGSVDHTVQLQRTCDVITLMAALSICRSSHKRHCQVNVGCFRGRRCHTTYHAHYLPVQRGVVRVKQCARTGSDLVPSRA
jgi:hypothetical protein